MTENVELYDNKYRILCTKLTFMDVPTLWSGWMDGGGRLEYVVIKPPEESEAEVRL